MKTRHWAPLALFAVAGAAFAAEPAKKPANTPQQAAATKPTAASPATNPGATRDWSRIDTNKDGHVSPEEMEKYRPRTPARCASNQPFAALASALRTNSFV
ncbi:hypothetical protein FSC37_21245 [Piscinibacter aquaticus]|uniref:EF-hand domain-containing protein n=1 Tax=Piscinibacter aquaticus TaxID=392597 RepID=A0A5C6U333_9BURK|nr:hypothetical protein FSC37_21245 [Piscinibacter aquaticus]